jgi:predicted aconitase
VYQTLNSQGDRTDVDFVLLGCPHASVDQVRRGALRAPARTEERGWLSIYQRLVRPLPEGAVLREPAP